MDRRKRDLFDLADKEGLKDIEIEVTNGCHYRLTGRHLGQPIRLVTSYSPSDHRTSMNVRSQIRRAMRAVEGTAA